MDIKQLDRDCIAATYNRFDVVFVGGGGSILRDENGKEYIDLGGGIAVNTFGIADARWAEAVSAQAGRLQHVSNLYYSEPQARLAQLLCQKTGMERVFFCNSGAEANECMIKAARKYSADKYGEGRSTIVTLHNSFHGRTITTLAATGQLQFHRHFMPFTDGFEYAEPDDIAAVEPLAGRGDVCAVMIELVQGEGGVRVLDAGYVRALAALCAERDILLLVDEVQTGNGRTGALYAYMKYGISPDIVSTAKGLGGGLPIGAAMFGAKTAGVLETGSHGSTFGGNPICAAGAISVLERLDDGLMAEVEQKGIFVRAFFEGARGVISVSGLGLMVGVETVRSPADIAAACLKRGVAALTAKNKLRLLPALNIPLETLRRGLEVLKEEIER